MAYFDEGSPGRSDMTVSRAADLPELTLVDGIRVHPVVGDKLLVQEVVLDPGSVAPIHVHDEEQIGYVVSGSCEFTDGKTTWSLAAGDWYHAPPGAPHGATAFDDGCVIIDAFSPPREQVLRMLAERSAQ
ncbi:MAG TPA: cupin domain-containing protein [Actinomycetota bacterium]|nr:cupin domain-containing protein [Actinomycetota bacterium]